MGFAFCEGPVIDPLADACTLLGLPTISAGGVTDFGNDQCRYKKTEYHL
jgi:hypothetical protein